MSEKRCALIENGVVVNVILADPGTFAAPAGHDIARRGGAASQYRR